MCTSPQNEEYTYYVVFTINNNNLLEKSAFGFTVSLITEWLLFVVH